MSLYISVLFFVTYLSCLVEDGRHDPRIQRRILHLHAQHTPLTQLPVNPTPSSLERGNIHTPLSHLLASFSPMIISEDMGIKV